MSANIKISLDVPFLDLNLDEMKLNEKDVQTLGKILAGALGNANKGNAIKYTSWALDFWKGNPVLIDESDKKELIKFVNEAVNLTNLMKSQIIKQLDYCETKPKLVDGKNPKDNK